MNKETDELLREYEILEETLKDLRDSLKELEEAYAIISSMDIKDIPQGPFDN